MYPTEIVHEGTRYQVVDDMPKDNDLVLTEKYGIWEYKETPHMLPYWCNYRTCKKLKSIGSILIPVN